MLFLRDPALGIEVGGANVRVPASVAVRCEGLRRSMGAKLLGFTERSLRLKHFLINKSSFLSLRNYVQHFILSSKIFMQMRNKCQLRLHYIK